MRRDVGDDERAARGHGFEDAIRRALEMTWRDQYVGSLEQRPHVADISGREDPARQRGELQVSNDGVPLWTVAAEYRPKPWVLRREPWQDRQQHADVLLGSEPAGERDQEIPSSYRNARRQCRLGRGDL